MARTVNQAERDARRAAILEAAIGIFARQGLEATPLADIAAVVGVRHPTILNYFESKDALFAAAVLDPLQQLGGVLRPQPGESLPALVARHIGLFMEQGSYLRLAQYVLAQAERFPELARELRTFVEQLRDDLAPSLLTTGCTPDEAAWRFWGYFSLLFGMAMVMDNTPAVREAMAERACAVLGVVPAG
jgi:AcrR family transcriptional regulator